MFTFVFTVENTESIPESSDASRGIISLEIGSTDLRDVGKYLDKLETNKPTGPDDFPPKLLKELKQQILKPLTAIYNLTLQQKQVLEIWKQANVTPILKKGDKSEALNYRSISLTSVAGKLFEKIIKDKFIKFLEDNKIISDAKHGFRNKRSCLTNLLDFFRSIYEIWDNHVPNNVIFFDFQKAFDKFPQKRLLKKTEIGGAGRHYDCLDQRLAH